MALKSYSSKTAYKRVLINGNQAKETRFKIKKYTAKSRCKAGHTIENKGTGNYRLALGSLFFYHFFNKNRNETKQCKNDQSDFYL